MTGGKVWDGAARALFDLRGPTAVSAGAGAGKTTCLVELCIRLLSGEATGTAADPAELVVITFTERAAAELDERLRAAVRARWADEPEGSAEERAWRVRLDGLDRAAIGTIHGFAARLLREHAAEAGIDPESSVLEEDVARLMRRDAARAAVIGALDAGGSLAADLCAGHGAGGRRAGLADLMVDLALARATRGDRSPPRPAPDRSGEALAARESARGLAAAIAALGPSVRTKSGRAALQALGAALGGLPEPGAPPDRRDLTVGDALAGALRSWRVGSTDPAEARGLRAELLAACERLGPLAAEVLAQPAQEELCRIVADAEARYAAAKREARALDFDDLLTGARDLLRSDEGLRSELRARYRALLVDEYQDVNALQRELFELLTQGEEPRPILVAVGDLKQSIYRFRGADVTVFRSLVERFSREAGARVLHLSRNHRSTPAVLEVVNEVSLRAMQPPAAQPRAYELAFGEEDRLRAVRAGEPGPACEVLEDGEGGPAAERRLREARAVALRVAALASGAAGVSVTGADCCPRPPRYGEVAVLFRRLTDVGPYARALREADVPYRLARGGGFYQAPEVRDLGELLASFAQPDDALAWAALLRSPFCGVSDSTLFDLSRLSLPTLGRRSPGEVLSALAREGRAGAPDPDELERLRQFLAVWQELAPLAGRAGAAELLVRAAEGLDLEAAHLAAPDGERRAANVRKAIALAESHDARGGTLPAFAARLRELARLPPREPEAEPEAVDAVSLLSVHQAKGLEWPVVFVPDLGALAPHDGRRALCDEEGRIALCFYDPELDLHRATATVEAARAEARRASAAESRRLLYVALTRARDHLVLSGEAPRGGDTWRALVEAAFLARPELVRRIPSGEAGTARAGETATATATATATEGTATTTTATPTPTPPPTPTPTATPTAPPTTTPPATPTTTPTTTPTAASTPTQRPLLLAAAPPPAPVRLAVTALSAHARCSRKVHLTRQLGLQEPAAGGSPAQDDPDRATARGTLAHAMLAEVDLTLSPLELRPQLSAVASRRGFDPRSTGVRRILGDVLQFLDAEPGKALVAAARAGLLRREVPFLLRLDSPEEGVPACYLSGSIDAIVSGRRRVEVVDFKYALATRGAADAYRVQLVAYSLAAGRAFPQHTVAASLQFLRGSCPRIDLTPSAAELRRFGREAPRLALAAHSGSELTKAPHEIGRTEARCREEGCGFAPRCHGQAALRAGS